MKVCLKSAALAFAMVAMLAGQAKAVQLWYDPFKTTTQGGTYVAGAPIGGQAAPVGGTNTFFTGSWTQAGGDDQLIFPDSLSKPGGRAVAGGSVADNATTGCCITGRNGLSFASPWDGFTNPDGTFYMSYLGNYGTGTLHHRVLEMWDGTMGDGDRNLQLGYSEFTGVQGPNHEMALSVHDSANNTNTTIPLSENLIYANDGMTHHIVLRFDLSNSGNDRIRAYLDPMTNTEPVVASADISVGEFLADRMGTITTFVFGPSTAPSFDELRVGSTFFDVRCVPEPATLSLLGLSAIGILFFGRRR